jgi:hypothetical protein
VGVDFAAIMDHHLSWDALYNLPATLNEELPWPSFGDSGVETAGGDRPNWRWRLNPSYSNVQEEFFEKRYAFLDGPAGFLCYVHEHCVEIQHILRWRTFLTNREVHHQMRQRLRWIAGVMKSQRIIYLPDSAFPPANAFDLLYEGARIEDIEFWLKSHIGPPFDSGKPFDEAAFAESVYLIEPV